LVEILLGSKQDNLPKSLRRRDFQTISSPLERLGEVQSLDGYKKEVYD
jgi:hypothetical protein